MKPHLPSIMRDTVLPLAWLMALCSGCATTPDDADELAASELGVSEQALDNSVDPDDGKACYVDGPKERKGRMDSAYCCYDTDDGNACVLCDADSQCTVGGGAGPIVSLTSAGWWTPPKGPPTVTAKTAGGVSRGP